MLLDSYDDLSDGVDAGFARADADLEVTGWLNLCPVGAVTGEIADAVAGLREVAAT
jgi:hypothetical protein